jgi:prepilin-type N-terminal cleavage/methylation domain-containing protein
MNLQKQKAFTLVELIVVITILAILWTIAFIAMSWYSKTARNSTRTSDMSEIKTSLELFHLNSDKYPDPTWAQPITYSGWLAWYQWIFWNSTFINVEKLDKVPKDPLTEKEYAYSVLNTKQEFEIAWIMERSDTALNTNINQTNAAEKTAIAKVSWTYNWLSLRVNVNNTSYILAVPSIITSIDLTDVNYRTLEAIIPARELVLNDYQNLPNNYIWTTYNSNKETENDNFTLVKENSISNILIHEWDIKDLTPEMLVEKLQAAYTWTTIATIVTTNELYQISTTELEKKVVFWENFINNNLWWSVEKRIYLECDWMPHNTTKSFYTVETTPFPILCDTVQQDLICIDWEWKDWETIVDITPYSTTCTEAWALGCSETSIGTLQIYTIPDLSHDDIYSDFIDILENNGTFKYAIDTKCYNWELIETVETWPELVTCDTWYYNNTWTSCEQQWSWDVTTWYLFKDTSWIEQYPLSCNDLLVQTTWKNIFIWSPYDGISFNDGVYYIKPDINPAFKVYCDMTTDWGGWSLVWKMLKDWSAALDFLANNYNTGDLNNLNITINASIKTSILNPSEVRYLPAIWWIVNLWVYYYLQIPSETTKLYEHIDSSSWGIRTKYPFYLTKDAWLTKYWWETSLWSNTFISRRLADIWWWLIFATQWYTNGSEGSNWASVMMARSTTSWRWSFAWVWVSTRYSTASVDSSYCVTVASCSDEYIPWWGVNKHGDLENILWNGIAVWADRLTPFVIFAR